MTNQSSFDSPPKEAQFIGMPSKISELVKTESDRGCILILAAYLEEILGLIINAACVTDRDADDILEFRGPAGGFDLKIRLCKAFALIHPLEVKGLQAVQKIRNSAAHFDNKRGFDVLFDSQQTIDYVQNLADSQNVKLRSKEPKLMRQLFVSGARILATSLFVRLSNVQRPKLPAATKELANEFRAKLKGTDIGAVLDEIEAGEGENLYQLLRALADTLHHGANASTTKSGD